MIPQSSNVSQNNAPVNVSDLPLEQLEAILERMNQEHAQLRNAVNQLQSADDEYVRCEDSLKYLCQDRNNSAEKKDFKNTLVPLTSSVYVKAEILSGNEAESNYSNVMVNVGTGYFVEQSVKSALEYYEKRRKFLLDQIAQVEALRSQKAQQGKMIEMIWRSKQVQAQK